MAGKVYLVGAGPGDPDLITLKGRRALEQAGCILYDNLAPTALLDLAPAGAERIYVGKKKAHHPVTQEEITDLLIERARRGLTVVRLKGGDPFIFGRGGEEAEALADAGIEFEVVPGVTTPLGIAAYCGVPLTHREHTSVVTFVTAHNPAEIDWARVAHAETLVLFMGLTSFPDVAQRLIAAGRSADTPAMAVRWATRPDQHTIVGTLATLPALLTAEKPPVTILLGDVVTLRDKLNWFERLPLFGKRIAVTRPHGQCAALASKLRALGAEPLLLPAIEIAAPSDGYAALDRAVAALDTYDWVVFTSVNGVRAFFERLDASARDLRSLRARIAAIGPATRASIEASHLRVDVMGAESVAESLIEALPADLSGRRVLLARAAVARDVLPATLAARGAAVDVAEAYRTLAPKDLPQSIVDAFVHPPDWITFTSSSTVTNFVEAAPAGAINRVRIASIGPVTTATLRKCGLSPTVEASTYDEDGLLEAILTVRA